MTEENGNLSDDDLSGIFDEEVGEADAKPTESDQNDDPSDTDDETSAGTDPAPAPVELSSVEKVLVAIKDGDGDDLKKFEEKISDDLDTVAASDDESQMLVITLCHQKNPSDRLAVRTLTGLAHRRSQLKREGKRVDYANLNAQVRSCLAGKLAWDDIAPVEYVPEPKTDVDPDMVEAGELAAALKCAVVDVLALADLKAGDAKTKVSRSKVAAALDALPTPVGESVDQAKPPLFDHEEPGNQPGDDVDQQVIGQIAVIKVEVEEPVPSAKQVLDEDPTPITGYEYITVAPDADLSQHNDHWFVKDCDEVAALYES